MAGISNPVLLPDDSPSENGNWVEYELLSGGFNEIENEQYRGDEDTEQLSENFNGNLSLNQVTELVLTNKLLLFHVEAKDEVLESFNMNSNRLNNFHFKIETNKVIDIIFVLQNHLKLITRLSDWVNSPYLIFQKHLGTSSWYFDIRGTPVTTMTLIGNLLFHGNPNLVIVGTDYQFYKQWQSYQSIKIENGKLHVAIDQTTFNKTIINLKTSFQPPQLVWLNQTILQLPNVSAAIISNFAPKINSDCDNDDDEFIRSILITLNMQEVSALIGRHGGRISSIRMETNCLIKIMPVEQSMKLLPQRAIQQQIFISGPVECVELAIDLIKQFLDLWKSSKNKYLE